MMIEDFYRECEAIHENGWMIAMLTDDYLVERWPGSSRPDPEKLLELRIFDANMECRLFRGDIGQEFHYRKLSDQDDRDTFDEVQYLDIDSRASEKEPGEYVISTGGGRYHLPLENTKDVRIKVRYYLDQYEQTGQARISDWRIVEFMEGENAAT